jgi:tRNA modification GTPase
VPAEPQPGQFWLGSFGDEVSDEVVLAVQGVRPFYRVEIHCHGGQQVVSLLLDCLERRGVRLCDWHALERLTEQDPLRALAASALVQAPTTRTAAILLDQYQGAFAQSLDAILAALSGGDTEGAARGLAQLVRYTGVGRHLTEPWRVTVAGAPNVGKSSLVNALAGYQRSVVAPTPGTTRDIVTTQVALEGWPVELADTAGVRAGAEALEAQGIGEAIAAAAAADLCLWVVDASVPPSWHDPGRLRVKTVINKIDLPAAWDLTTAADAFTVSARTGQGISDLCQAIAHSLVPEVPSAGAALAFTPDLCAMVEEAQACLDRGETAEALRVLRAVRGEGTSQGR